MFSEVAVLKSFYIMAKNIKIILKILSTNGSSSVVTSNELHLTSIQYSSELDGYVLLHSSCYKDIFGKTKTNSSDNSKRTSIVKIKTSEKTIYREFKGFTLTGFDANMVALSPNSLYLLNLSNSIESSELKLTPGCILPFYWFHPDKSIRLSFKMGLLSIILGVISLVLGVLSVLIANG